MNTKKNNFKKKVSNKKRKYKRKRSLIYKKYRKIKSKKGGGCREKIEGTNKWGTVTPNITKNQYKSCNNIITTIDLKEGIVSIEAYTFQNFKNLTNVNLSNTNLITLSNYTFSGCTNLSVVTFPNTLKSIGEGVFRECSNLKALQFPNSLESIGKDSFKNSGLTNIDLSNTQVSFPTEESCFEGCNNLTIVNLNTPTIKQLSKNTFKNLRNLKTVILNDLLETIGAFCFMDCRNLSEINFPSKLNKIGISAFENCYELTGKINLPTLNTLSKNAFSNCYKLEGVDFNGNQSLEIIDSFAFQNCEELKNINLPISITNINGFAFKGCTKLENLILPQNLKQISSYSFGYCESLIELIFPASLQLLYENSFAECKNLKTIKFKKHNPPLSNTYIGPYIQKNSFTNCGTVTSFVKQNIVNVVIDPYGNKGDVVKGYGDKNILDNTWYKLSPESKLWM